MYQIEVIGKNKEFMCYFISTKQIDDEAKGSIVFDFKKFVAFWIINEECDIIELNFSNSCSQLRSMSLNSELYFNYSPEIIF